MGDDTSQAPGSQCARRHHANIGVGAAALRIGLCSALGVVIACVTFLLSFLAREQTTSASDELVATVVAVMVGVAVGGCLGAVVGWIWLIVSINREHGREREPRRCPSCGRATG